MLHSTKLAPLPFSGLYALVFWLVCVWVYYPEFRILREAKRSLRQAPQGTADPSYRPLVAGQQIVIFLGIVTAFLFPELTMPYYRPAIFSVGLLITIAGSLLRRHCFRTLGNDFRGAVTVREDQPVVERGAYRYVRHPSYAAALLLHIGFALAFTNWGTLVVILLGAPPLFMYRIRVEERALATRIGEPYVAYMSRTKRLVPGVW